MFKKPDSVELDNSLVYGLLASILLVSAPHAAHLPPWVIALGSTLLGWRAYLNYSGNPLPPRWLLFLLSIASITGIFLGFHTIFGRDAGVTLLILLAALKLLELRAARDATVLIYLCCFIIITNFFYSQSIPTALVMLVSLLVILAAWIHLHGAALNLGQRLAIAAKLLLQAVPLTLLLFVLFPRVQGPLWGMPQDAYSSSGLTDTMAPGTISKLSLSQAVAFRVNFEEAAPAHEQMYWRGPVLADYDGVTWRTGNKLRNQPVQLEGTSNPVNYTVTLEPHNKTWLFALEMPARLSVANVITDDFQVQSRMPVTSRIRYKTRSYLTFSANIEETPKLLLQTLALPRDFNPRARTLAGEWRASFNNDDAIIRAALAYFNRENFVYTLEPPLLGRHSVDDFLFETRQGFCEHYASSFVFLMRAAGIPARVVTGYQGGEYNALGDYTIVRQSDAHAWAEVWLKQRGWIRIDPTAAISPERIQNGLSAAIPDSETLPFIARMQSPWLLKMRFNLDMLNHQWNQWVLGYDTERQFAFLTRLGMEDISWQKMATKLLIGVALLAGLIALLLLRKLYQQQTDATLALYLKFCKKLARGGIVRASHEGPQDFAARAAAALPKNATAIHRITARYLALRYENKPDADGLRGLRREVTAFKL